MSRLEEVNKTIKKLEDTISRLGENGLNDKTLTNINLASIGTMLGDISISMAMIADRLAESEDKE